MEFKSEMLNFDGKYKRVTRVRRVAEQVDSVEIRYLNKGTTVPDLSVILHIYRAGSREGE